MISVSLSDITKVLDKLPLWKALSAMPDRIKELEQRVSALEERAADAAKAPAVPSALTCPMCAGRMKVTGERSHPEFGVFGMKVHAVQCAACGHTTELNFKPSEGYK